MSHLWEHEHPYTGPKGNYYLAANRRREVTQEYDSWAGFLAEHGDSDPDYNLVYRWDWTPAEDGEDAELLEIFFVQQRRANLCSAEVRVTRDDEPAVRAWLTERARTLIALWAPLDLAGGAS